jgi:hypothetical protein
MAQAWLVRAGRDDEFARQAMDESVIGLGWRRVGDLKERRTMSAVAATAHEAYAEFTARSRTELAVQLFAFRSHMRTGDYVILIRANAPDVALGVVTGDYMFRPDLSAPHVRLVRWERDSVRPSEIGADLLTFPALTNIYKINRPDAESRLAKAMVAATEALPAAEAPSTSAYLAGPMENLRNNLDYAMSLATAGHHFQQLQVASFEVSDVFRAAWVQAVAALDHWVHQELKVRMLALMLTPPSARTPRFRNFSLPRPLIDQIADGTLSVREAVDQHFEKAYGHRTFQQPRAIVAALSAVADADELWIRVAAWITDRSAGEATRTAGEIEERLRDIVFRRNRIAHSYDEDPDTPPAKKEIDTATTTQVIRFIGEMAEAVVAVLDA